MFLGLLSVFTIKDFGEPLTLNSKEPKKCVSRKKQPCQTRPTL